MNTALKQYHHKLQPLLQLGLRLFLGWVFITSGWEKLQAMHVFVPMVLAYKVLPDQLALIYAKALPWVELLAGSYLVIGLFTRYAAGAIGAMLLSFIIAIAMVLIRGDVIDCGCFVGGKVEPVDLNLLLRDVGMLTGCVYLMLQTQFKLSIDSLLTKE